MEFITYKMSKSSPPERSARSSEQPISEHSDPSVKSSKFESLSDFETWLAKDQRRLEEGNVGSIQSHILHASNATYTLEEASTPLKRWRCVIEDSPKRGRRRYYARRRRGKSSSDDVNVSPKYFEPWYWKGTTRDPYRRREPYPIRSDQYEDESSFSSTFVVIVGLLILVVVVVLVVKNRESVHDWFNLSQYFTNDYNTVKGRVEGDVKDMIGSNFKEVSWKYDDVEPETAGHSFEEAIEENDPTVVEHIKNFEEHLKKKPGKFFPSGKKSLLVPMRVGNHEY